MWSILALGAVERLIHQCIDLDAISRIQLNQLQGKVLRVVIDSPQLSVDVVFDQAKVRLEPTVTGHTEKVSIFEQRPFDQAVSIHVATATLHVRNVVELIKLLLAEDVGNIPLQGDYHLLQDIQRIIQQAEPDLAAHLSRWVGPALAHEIAKIKIVPKQLNRSMKSKLFFAEDFIKEDLGVFAARWQMDDLQQDGRQLNQDIDRLEARVHQLQQKLQQAKPSQHPIQDNTQQSPQDSAQQSLQNNTPQPPHQD
ncbi:ubiquinone biosynthesis protein UbiJ [Acinetobacter calcoaceticus]|uniref:Ubiquinone biosynthesis protein UbiJ n=1 Tax=Acinetobacter calcoaceticus TaxID=471 RepID=A0A4R1Y734_ACICA|nr:ubiquinone biosynthesis protein UbiJ [Acinetobacter calcoaceticus]